MYLLVLFLYIYYAIELWRVVNMGFNMTQTKFYSEFCLFAHIFDLIEASLCHFNIDQIKCFDFIDRVPNFWTARLTTPNNNGNDIAVLSSYFKRTHYNKLILKFSNDFFNLNAFLLIFSY